MTITKLLLTASAGLLAQLTTVANADIASVDACQAGAQETPVGELAVTRIEVANSAANGLYEGPVWKDGVLYFSHFLFSEGFPSNVMAFDGSTLAAALPNSGSNGLALNEKGELIAGTHKYKAVSVLDVTEGTVTPWVTEYEGEVFNSPNDLTVATDGRLYFTDPNFQTAAAPGGQPVTGVYELADGQLRLIDASIANPNGVSLSPDNATLYVAGGGEQGFVRAYDLTSPFPYKSSTFVENVHIPDGMAIDCLGNVYVTEHINKRLRVFTPAGEEIAGAQFDANVTNAAFGGEHGKTLFVTGMGSLWKIELNIAGYPY